MPLEIREIKLYNQFEINRKKSSEWFSFGRYNSLSITRLACSSTQNMLEYIRNAASCNSTALSDVEHTSSYYAFCDYQPEELDAFWQHQDDYSLMIVTFIHANKRSSKDADLCSSLSTYLEKELANEYRSQSKYIVYSAFDNCDAIIFWLTDSYKYVTDILDNLLVFNTSVEFLHSILGCHYAMVDHSFEDIANHKQKWYAAEALIPLVYLRFNALNSENALSFANDLCYEFPFYFSFIRYNNTIQITFLNLEPRQLSDIVSMIILSHKRICDHGITYEIDPFFQEIRNPPSPQATFSNPFLARKLIMQLKNVVTDNLLKEYLNSSTWYPATLDLLNELSQLECIPASYYIYILFIGPQKHFVDYLCNTIINPPLPAETSSTILDIQDYLRGWSQMLYHAKQTQSFFLQLPQASRLYFFPLKLYLLYLSLIQATAKFLSDRPNDSSTPPCSFFLVPIHGGEVSFRPIHSDKNAHTLLAYGEVPADMLFRPNILFPVLIHEIAHYVGSESRCRKLRRVCIYASLTGAIFFRKIKELFNQNLCEKDQKLILLDIIDKAISKSFVEESDDNIHIEYVENEAESLIKWLYTDHYYIDMDEVILSSYFELISSSRINTKFLPAKVLSKPKCICIEDEISDTINGLHILYRECFSDLCMVTTLNLSAAEYLACILNILRVDSSETLKNICSIDVQCERWIIILKLLWNLEVEDSGGFKSKVTKELYSSIPLHPLLYHFADTLLNYEVNHSALSPASVVITCLYIYLCHCNEKLTALPRGSGNIHSDLENVYHALSTQEISKENYSLCKRMIEMYTTSIIEQFDN